jgi:hypothetical protein
VCVWGEGDAPSQGAGRRPGRGPGGPSWSCPAAPRRAARHPRAIGPCPGQREREQAGLGRTGPGGDSDLEVEDEVGKERGHGKGHVPPVVELQRQPHRALPRRAPPPRPPPPCGRVLEPAGRCKRARGARASRQLRRPARTIGFRTRMEGGDDVEEITRTRTHQGAHIKARTTSA